MKETVNHFHDLATPVTTDKLSETLAREVRKPDGPPMHSSLKWSGLAVLRENH